MSNNNVSKTCADFDPGFKEALESLRTLKGEALRCIGKTPMTLADGQVVVLVSCALALLDRFDRKRAYDMLLENFRYTPSYEDLERRPDRKRESND